jgi:hypothetical protein
MTSRINHFPGTSLNEHTPLQALNLLVEYRRIR